MIPRKEQKCAVKSRVSAFEFQNLLSPSRRPHQLDRCTLPLQQHFHSKVVEVKWYIPTLHFPVDRRRNGSNRILH